MACVAHSSLKTQRCISCRLFSYWADQFTRLSLLTDFLGTPRNRDRMQPPHANYEFAVNVPISFPEAAFLLVSTKEARRVADAGLNARGLWERDCKRSCF